MGELAVIETQAAIVGRQQAAATNPAVAYLARLSPRSRGVQLSALRCIARICHSTPDTLSWESLTYTQVAWIRNELAGQYAPATANRCLAALKGTLEEAWRLGLISAEASERARDIKPIRGSRIPKGRALPSDELSSLFRVCKKDPSPAGLRDAALLAILYGCGLRRSEAVGLDVIDTTVRPGWIRVRQGKGNKDREVPTPEFVDNYVNAWLTSAGITSGALFCRVRRGGLILPGARLADQTVLALVRKRCTQARIADASPHDFRRTLAGDLLDSGTDIATVQMILGHANVSTTQKYDRRGDAVRKRAILKIRLEV